MASPLFSQAMRHISPLILSALLMISCANGGAGEEAPCGNGTVDIDEACDGENLAEATCISLGYYGGTLACNSDCTFNLNACAAEGECGDGVLHALFGEECDGEELGTGSCASLGYGDGELACGADCNYDFSGCSGAPACGDHIRNGDEQCDDADFGGVTCESLGLGAGNLSCTSACIIDSGACESQPVCGDSTLSAPMEECDDGGTTPGDGCAADCTVESGWSCTDTAPSVCMIIPEPPVIEGELSAGHDSPTWLWSAPEGASSYRVRVDGGTWSSTAAREHTATGLAEGAHNIEVTACNELGGCSSAATFTTSITYYGTTNPPWWRGVARTGLARTAIGNLVPISCHNCYNGPSNEVYTTAGALAKIHNALTRGADLIELDIADAGGTMCVYHGDPSSCAGSPSLSEILTDAALAASDAMLFIELKEGGMSPSDFATALLDILDSHREFVRNGRPLFVRAFNSKLNYLQAIANALPDYPLIANYIRLSVLYGKNAIANVAQFQADLATSVAGNQFHFVEFDYRQKHLLGLTAYAHHLGLGAGVYTVPGSFGEAFTAALREEVDQITVEYRVDLARQVIELQNTHAYINTADCQSAADTTVTVLSDTGSGVVTTPVVVGITPATTAGTPPLHYDPVGEDRFGCSLDFRASTGVTDRYINLGTHPPQSSAGFFITAYVNFDVLGSLSGTMAIMNSAEAGGFALELYNSGAAVYLRFGVRVGTEYVYHSYNISATGLAAPNSSINGADGYFLVGAYDGDGGVYLWIDNERAGTAGSATGGVVNSNQPTLLGADPQPGSDYDARFWFDGLIQQASVQAWGDHPYTGSNVND